ncbi:MAG: hypothetical protein KIT74_06210 [Fimbriimonadales bacterium]|nr:hypothetical protein [Fimbriimonadales bacterium]
MSKKSKLAAISLIVVAVFGAMVYFVWPRQKLDREVSEFAAAIVSGDSATAYSKLFEIEKKRITLDQFAKVHEKVLHEVPLKIREEVEPRVDDFSARKTIRFIVDDVHRFTCAFEYFADPPGAAGMNTLFRILALYVRARDSMRIYESMRAAAKEYRHFFESEGITEIYFTMWGVWLTFDQLEKIDSGNRPGADSGTG